MTGPRDINTQGDLRSFGRRRGRKPSNRQEHLLADLLPKFSVELKTAPPVELTALFEGTRCTDTWLEIGFGGAEHLVWQAEQNPNIAMIGAEPFEDGVVKALAAIEDKGLKNIRLHADDVRPLLRWLREASIGRAFILFPDPWPKKKHVKRRLVSVQLFALLARVMKKGARLRIATDIGDYARMVLLAATQSPHFRWLADGPEAWRSQPPDWPGTRYQAKAIREGRRCYFLQFERL